MCLVTVCCIGVATLGSAAGFVMIGIFACCARSMICVAFLMGGAGDAGVVTCWKIRESCSRAAICLSPTRANGAAGAGFCSAWMSSVAAIVAFSIEERNGILELCGKNSTVSACITALVSGK